MATRARNLESESTLSSSAICRRKKKAIEELLNASKKLQLNITCLLPCMVKPASRGKAINVFSNFFHCFQIENEKNFASKDTSSAAERT